jgi:heat shock protein HtpX
MTDVSAARFTADRSLSARMVSVMVLLAVVYAAALTALVFVLGKAWPLGVAVVVGFAVFHIATSGKVAMKTMGASEVSPAQEPELHAVVDRLCALGGMSKPLIAVAETRVPNAFAVGRSKKATYLCVTRGLLDTLEPTELEAVVAHELAHVEHGDAAVMTVASLVGVLAALVARIGLKLVYFGARAPRLWGLLVGVIGVLVLSGATWFASVLLTRSLSRYREFAADRSAAQLTGNPSALASALAKVSDAVQNGGGRIPTQDLRKAQALNAFHFCPVASSSKHAERRWDGLRHDLFSTHPTTEARMARLAKLSSDLSR